MSSRIEQIIEEIEGQRGYSGRAPYQVGGHGLPLRLFGGAAGELTPLATPVRLVYNGASPPPFRRQKQEARL